MNNKKKRDEKTRIIKRVVSGYFNKSVDDVLQDRSRKRGVKVPRQFIKYYLYHYLDMGWSEIADATCNDHATAIHSVKVISDLIEVDEFYQEMHNDMTRRIDQEMLNSLKLNLHHDLRRKQRGQHNRGYQRSRGLQQRAVLV